MEAMCNLQKINRIPVFFLWNLNFFGSSLINMWISHIGMGSFLEINGTEGLFLGYDIFTGSSLIGMINFL